VTDDPEEVVSKVHLYCEAQRTQKEPYVSYVETEEF